MVNIEVDVLEVAIIRWEMQPLLIAFTPDLNWFVWRFSERLEYMLYILQPAKEIACTGQIDTMCVKFASSITANMTPLYQ